MNWAFKLLLLVMFVAVSVAWAGEDGVVTVRGRIIRGDKKAIPIPFMRVTLTPASKDKVLDEKRRRVELTDSDGMYYFTKTPRGIYALEVWSAVEKDRRIEVRFYQVHAKNKYFDISPINVGGEKK